MKKLILSIYTVILFSNFVSAQSGVDLSNRFNMNGVHIDTNSRVIGVRSTRPEAVRLKNPLVAEPKTFGVVFVATLGVLCLAIGFLLGYLVSLRDYIKLRDYMIRNKK